MILEVDLNNFVAETEHDGMSRPHPLFDVHGAGRRFRLRIESTHAAEVILLRMLVRCTLLSRARLQIAFEVL